MNSHNGQPSREAAKPPKGVQVYSLKRPNNLENIKVAV
jgi:hypothetical protein